MKRVLMMLFLAGGLNLDYTLNAATAIGVIRLEKVYKGYSKNELENKKLKTKLLKQKIQKMIRKKKMLLMLKL